MRVLVTGAAGFLGRWFVQHHANDGDYVVGVDDLSNVHSYWPEAQMIKIEQEIGSWLSRTNQQFDLAYHFAAPVGGRLKIEGDPLFNADSLRIDSLFFRWAINHTRRVVYPSSSAVYGTIYQDERGVALQESMFSVGAISWPTPDEMYGFTKLVGEKLAWTAASYGLSTLCIRPFSGYGEGQSLEYPIPSIAARALRHEDPIIIWGSGQQRRDFIHVSDVIETVLSRLDAGLSGYKSLNIGSGESTSFLEIAKLCAEIVGYRPVFQTDPTKPEGVMTRYADIERMLKYHKPQVGLREGLKRVIDSL